MKKKLLSTGEAAKICSVTPNTVLKWIYSGKLPARRTAGGHYRILEEDIQNLNGTPGDKGFDRETQVPYCWEFHAENSGIRQSCCECTIYKGRALRCYELRSLFKNGNAHQTYCVQECDNCEYFLSTADKPTVRILIITDDFDLTIQVSDMLDPDRYEVRFGRTLAECTTTIYRHDPHVLFLDMDLQAEDPRELLHNITEESNSFAGKIILTATQKKKSQPKYTFLQKPFAKNAMLSILAEISPLDKLDANAKINNMAKRVERDARKSKSELTEAHLIVMNFVQEYHRNVGKNPTLAKIAKATGLSSREITRLFPCDLVEGALRVIALPDSHGYLANA